MVTRCHLEPRGQANSAFWLGLKAELLLAFSHVPWYYLARHDRWFGKKGKPATPVLASAETS